MRMYGREKIDVVKPTKAVSATRNTLNGSTKNCSVERRAAARGDHAHGQRDGRGEKRERS